ncbi:MAG: hypothetical protein WAW02_02530 [Sideroxyarcus sp.]
MESAIFGLIGVALGSALTVAREWWFQSRKDKKDAEYLAIQISCALEQYVAGCAAVVADDGLCEGQTDERGYYRTQVQPPIFETDSLKVEWKALPGKLMYEVLDFPYRAELASQLVSAAFEFDSPPDFAEGFDERQYQYAMLGIAASDLAEKLRNHVDLPARGKGEWDPIAFMKEAKAAIELRRKERASRAYVAI